MQHADAGRAASAAGQPTPGRVVGQDAVWCVGPAHPEQLRQDRLVRLDEALLVARVRATFLGGQERGTRDSSRGAGIKRGSDVRGAGDPAGDDHRHLRTDHSEHLVEQLERR